MRLFENLLGGEIDALLDTAATTMSSPELADMPVVASPDTMRLVIDPDGSDPEIVIVTAHTASATTATITREAEGTTDQTHASGTRWDHTYTAGDTAEAHRTASDVVADAGSTEDLAFAVAASGRVHDVTMTEDCAVSFSGAEDGLPCTMTVILRGDFAPTWPGSVEWPGGIEPVHADPSVYEFVTLDGGTNVVGWKAAALNPGYAVEVFTASGSFDIGDYPWARSVKVTAVGAGGGGGGAPATGAGQVSGGGGGGGGSTAIVRLAVADLASTETVTVGDFGGGGFGANNGTAGGSSSFGTHAVAGGGGGGGFVPATTPPIGGPAQSGGVATAGDILIKGGGAGAPALLNHAGGINGANGGFGGSSTHGGGAKSARVATEEAGGNYGAGGSGAARTASSTALTGGTGSNGIVIVEIYG
jgi:hypothetical protein